jgi:hypothetical protein
MIRRKLPIALSAILVCAAQAQAADICSAILANGTYDKSETYTTNANFNLVYNTLCKGSVETYQDATSSSGNLGVSIIDVLDAAIGGSTNSTNYSQRKSQFCSLNFSSVSSNSTVLTKVQVASRIIASAWESCVLRATGFVSWVTVSKNLDAFTISMRNNGPLGVFQVYQISHPNVSGIVCDGNAQNATRDNPIAFQTREVNIGCTKPTTETIQISMDTSAGNLSPVDLPGTVAVLDDLQTQIKALQAAANVLPPGTIIPWFSKSGRIPDSWGRLRRVEQYAGPEK